MRVNSLNFSFDVNNVIRSYVPLVTDEEIGDEFLTSWKSISVMEDDGMDFGFDTVSKGSKGKKKVFDFEKL